MQGLVRGTETRTMRTLMLMRHAKSSWDRPELDDLDRPLDRAGRRPRR